jgi:hypothetical protein
MAYYGPFNFLMFIGREILYQIQTRGKDAEVFAKY